MNSCWKTAKLRSDCRNAILALERCVNGVYVYLVWYGRRHVLLNRSAAEKNTMQFIPVIWLFLQTLNKLILINYTCLHCFLCWNFTEWLMTLKPHVQYKSWLVQGAIYPCPFIWKCFFHPNHQKMFVLNSEPPGDSHFFCSPLISWKPAMKSAGYEKPCMHTNSLDTKLFRFLLRETIIIYNKLNRNSVVLEVLSQLS